MAKKTNLSTKINLAHSNSELLYSKNYTKRRPKCAMHLTLLNFILEILFDLHDFDKQKNKGAAGGKILSDDTLSKWYIPAVASVVRALLLSLCVA